MNELFRTSATALRQLIYKREISCRDVMASTLERISAIEPQINAFALIDADEALGAANRADKALSKGATTGPLHGIPFTVKDLLDVEGVETGFGSWLMEGNIATADAEAVRRLKTAGAIPIGKTTTPEFAGSVLTESLRYGVTRNPWNPDYTCGGSSGGAGAAVASGCGPLGLATDGAGSARIPASCCGVLGLKPTLGRVAHPQGPDLFATFTHIGLLARTLPDLALMLDVMSGPHDGDPWSLSRSWDPIAVSAGHHVTANTQRAWYFPLLGNDRLAGNVSTLCADALAHLCERGLDIEAHDSALDWGIDASRTIMRSLMSARMGQFDETARQRMGAGMRRAIKEGEGMDADAVKQAPLARARLFQMVQGLLAERPILLSPTLSAAPPLATFDPVGDFQIDGHAVGDLRAGWFTYPTPFNLTGHPAISIPIGFTHDGLPVGLQAVAGWGQEQALFDLASSLQEHFAWPDHWPGHDRQELRK
jgi:aspartyl-tRNA(Asn)/glutamyl-tRNA(Gln) amidotransferase subunit A